MRNIIQSWDTIACEGSPPYPSTCVTLVAWQTKWVGRFEPFVIKKTVGTLQNTCTTEKERERESENAVQTAVGSDDVTIS